MNDSRALEALMQSMTAAEGAPVSIQASGMDEVRAMLDGIPGAIQAAVARALNKTAKRVRTEIVRRAQDVIGTRTQKEIRKALWVERAKPSDLSAIVSTKSRRIPVTEAAGLSWDRLYPGVYFDAWGRRTLLRHAFMASLGKNKETGKRWKKGVYMRKGKKRFPVNVKFLRSPTTALETFIDALIEEGEGFLDTDLMQAAESILAQSAAAGHPGARERLWEVLRSRMASEAAAVAS